MFDMMSSISSLSSPSAAISLIESNVRSNNLRLFFSESSMHAYDFSEVKYFSYISALNSSLNFCLTFLYPVVEHNAKSLNVFS